MFVVDEITKGEEDGNACNADCAPSGKACQIGDCTASVLEAILYELTKSQECVSVDRKQDSRRCIFDLGAYLMKHGAFPGP